MPHGLSHAAGLTLGMLRTIPRTGYTEGAGAEAGCLDPGETLDQTSTVPIPILRGLQITAVAVGLQEGGAAAANPLLLVANPPGAGLGAGPGAGEATGERPPIHRTALRSRQGGKRGRGPMRLRDVSWKCSEFVALAPPPGYSGVAVRTPDASYPEEDSAWNQGAAQGRALCQRVSNLQTRSYTLLSGILRAPTEARGVRRCASGDYDVQMQIRGTSL